MKREELKNGPLRRQEPLSRVFRPEGNETAGGPGFGAQTSREQIQPSLRIGRVDDPAENEADRVAAEVVHRAERPGKSSAEGPALRTTHIHRRAEESATLQIRRGPRPFAGDAPVSGAFAEDVRRERDAGGTPLGIDLRAALEPPFGRDLSRVRVHHGDRAASLARQIDARAFTFGRDIFFDHGEYRPADRRGRTLIAHELTHVIQQGAHAGAPRIDAGQIQRACASCSQERDDVLQRSPRGSQAPDESQQDAQPPENAGDIAEMTGCSPDQLTAIGAARRRAITTLERALSQLRSKDKSAAPVIEFFLGALDEKQHTTLLQTLEGVRQKLLDLRPERYTCTQGASGAKFIPIGQESPGRYEFEDVAPDTATATARPRAPDELTSPGKLAFTMIHEATHDYIIKSLGDWQAPDFSSPHGVVSVLPALAGIDPLRNAESIAAVAISLGMGEFSVMKLQAVQSMHAPGKPGLERKLQVSVVGYAQTVHRLVHERFAPATRADGAKRLWVKEFVGENLTAGVLRRNIDWATMRRPSESTANDGELGRLYELMKRGYGAVGEVLTIDVRRILDTEAASASLEQDILRVPGALLARIRGVARSAGPQKIPRQQFLAFVAELLAGIMHDDYKRRRDFTAMIARPQQFWYRLAWSWFDSGGVASEHVGLTE